MRETPGGPPANLCSQLCQRHFLISLKHGGGGGQSLDCACLCLANRVQLRSGKPAALGQEGGFFFFGYAGQIWWPGRLQPFAWGEEGYVVLALTQLWWPFGIMSSTNFLWSALSTLEQHHGSYRRSCHAALVCPSTVSTNMTVPRLIGRGLW